MSTALAEEAKSATVSTSGGKENVPPEEMSSKTVTKEPEKAPEPSGHAYGWKPSLPDFRLVEADTAKLRILKEVDPRNEMQPCYDQGQLGSCTANAIAGAIEYDAILNDEHYGTPSRLFIYYLERVLEGTVSYDSGAYGHDGFKVARKTGVCPEADLPYDIAKFTEKPSEQCYEDAAEHRIGRYVHPGLSMAPNDWEQRKDAFKALLSNNQTIAFGFTVFESFESPEVEKTGVVPMPEAGEKELGGHEVLIVGYLQDDPNYALVRNSWGTRWGLEGYCLMPWELICNPQYSGDWRSIYRPLV